MQKITPFLWFDTQAEEAANFYVSLLENSKIKSISRYDDGSAQASGRPNGSVMTVSFQLAGQEFVALNGGPQFKFTEAVSFMVSCESQDEVDRLWTKLTEDGTPIQCGWLKDKYGLAWQIVPRVFMEMISDEDPQKVKRVMAAMMQMTKFEISKLQQAYEGQ